MKTRLASGLSSYPIDCQTTQAIHYSDFFPKLSSFLAKNFLHLCDGTVKISGKCGGERKADNQKGKCGGESKRKDSLLALPPPQLLQFLLRTSRLSAPRHRREKRKCLESNPSSELPVLPERRNACGGFFCKCPNDACLRPKQHKESISYLPMHQFLSDSIPPF